jgi:hypothetical protein
MPENETKITLKDATLADIQAQAEQSRQLYEIQRSIYKAVREPGELSMDFVIKNKAGEVGKGTEVTWDRLQAEASRFRILHAIHRHVQEHVADAVSFTLTFTLSCFRRAGDGDGGGIEPAQF